jgi:hypothetical protein
MTESTTEDTRFLELVLIFQQAAWQGLGKMSDQATGKNEPNLDQASHAIDMLAMLQKKTHGNLNDVEEKLIANALTQLRLNFVETQKEAPTPTPEAAPEAPAEPESDDSSESSSEPSK